MTDPAARVGHRVVMAVDAGHELKDLLGAVPEPPPKPPLRSLLNGLGAWVAFIQSRSHEPGADLVRRICNQADVYGDAAAGVGRLLGDAELVQAADALTHEATRLWSGQIDAMTLRQRSREVADLLLPYHRQASLGRLGRISE